MDRDHGGDERREERRWARRYSRPYVVTGGRTRPSHTNFDVEALTSLTRHGETMLPLLNDEWRAIAGLCHEAFYSIAEISAHLQVPLGVARVLVGDMVAEGLVTVHETAGSRPGDRPDRALLERVLDGLRRLPT
jgi:hypothetical protein